MKKETIQAVIDLSANNSGSKTIIAFNTLRESRLAFQEFIDYMRPNSSLKKFVKVGNQIDLSMETSNKSKIYFKHFTDTNSARGFYSDYLVVPYTCINNATLQLLMDRCKVFVINEKY